MFIISVFHPLAQYELFATICLFVFKPFCDISQKGFDLKYRRDWHIESDMHRSLVESLSIVAQQLHTC